jgi:hypothetical protein
MRKSALNVNLFQRARVFPDIPDRAGAGSTNRRSGAIITAMSMQLIGALVSRAIGVGLIVAPAAIVNPRTRTLSKPYQAEEIVRRLETRVAARISEVLSGLSEQSLTATVRSEVNPRSNSRVYTLIVQTTDKSGNSTTKSLTITVRK